MACFLSISSWVSPINPSSYSSSRPFFPQPRGRRFQPSCNASNGADQNQKSKNAQTFRRDVLIGLGSGGLYGAANLASSSNPFALADPIPHPDLENCVLAKTDYTKEEIYCCPPLTDNIVDYILPPPSNIKRFRPAAHMVTPEYIFKYKTAVDRMRRLPENDPCNFMQQANVHCAYCNGAYEYPFNCGTKEIQIHKSWLFFPFHRWYLYFYERILGSLIDDPTFGLPFWNWDGAASGMKIPPMFLEEKSPLNNENRNPNHFKSIVDLAYSGEDRDNIRPEDNWSLMRKEMIDTAQCIESFMGLCYKKGDDTNPGEGTVEKGSHTALHSWVGRKPNPPNNTGEDLGNLYSSGRDPLFYALHANVDRLWTIWRDRRGRRQKDFKDPDYLNAQFLFYDEKRRLVRVRVADCLEQYRMGYVFQTDGVDIPWLRVERPTVVRRSRVAVTRARDAQKVDPVRLPLKLDKTAKVLVARPKKSRKQDEKEREEEILEIVVEVDTQQFVKFDVFVNDEDENVDKFGRAEYSGTFSQIPQKRKDPSTVKTAVRLELTRQLEDLDAEDDDAILVALVPRAGEVTITTIKIIYSPS